MRALCLNRFGCSHVGLKPPRLSLRVRHSSHSGACSHGQGGAWHAFAWPASCRLYRVLVHWQCVLVPQGLVPQGGGAGGTSHIILGPHDDAWRDGCCDAALRSRATSHSHALSPFVSRRCVTAAGLEKDVPTPVSLFFTFLLGPLGLTFHLITRFSPRPVPRPRPCLNPEASTLPVSVSLCLSSVSVYCVCHECRPRAVLARVGP